MEPDVFREKVQRARKQYRCCECKSVINRGDKYRYTFGVWDSVTHVYRQCEPCGQIFRDCTDFSYQDPYTTWEYAPLYECLHDWLNDHSGNMNLDMYNSKSGWSEELGKVLEMEPKVLSDFHYRFVTNHKHISFAKAAKQ